MGHPPLGASRPKIADILINKRNNVKADRTGQSHPVKSSCLQIVRATSRSVKSGCRQIGRPCTHDAYGNQLKARNAITGARLPGHLPVPSGEGSARVVRAWVPNGSVTGAHNLAENSARTHLTDVFDSFACYPQKEGS